MARLGWGLLMWVHNRAKLSAFPSQIGCLFRCVSLFFFFFFFFFFFLFFFFFFFFFLSTFCFSALCCDRDQALAMFGGGHVSWCSCGHAAQLADEQALFPPVSASPPHFWGLLLFGHLLQGRLRNQRWLPETCLAASRCKQYLLQSLQVRLVAGHRTHSNPQHHNHAREVAAFKAHHELGQG